MEQIGNGRLNTRRSDIVVVEEVQDGVNILYCKLKVNDNTI